MKNRILKLVCIFSVFTASLYAQPHCVREGGIFVCDSVDLSNESDVRDEIMDFYREKYLKTTPITVLGYDEMLTELGLFMANLLTSPDIEGDCYQEKPKSTDVRPSASEDKSYDIYFRWKNGLPNVQEYYSSYLDFTDGLDDFSSELTTPGMVLNVPRTTLEKLYALNVRCDAAQSSYYIIIIDKDLLPATENSDTENEDENLMSSEASLKTFPNPVSGEAISIDVYLPQEEQASISLIEGTTGKQIKTIVPNTMFLKGHNYQKVDLNEFSSGVYYLLLQTDEERIVKKIIKI